jgi:hypothetical protein
MPDDDKKPTSGSSECPKCGYELSYTGGYCFGCGTYRRGCGGGDGRASGRKDMVDYFKTNIGFRIMKYRREDDNEDFMDYL